MGKWETEENGPMAFFPNSSSRADRELAPGTAVPGTRRPALLSGALSGKRGRERGGGPGEARRAGVAEL